MPVKSVADAAVLADLERRLMALQPDAIRRWGTLEPGEMLCHLGDATASVLARPGGKPGPRRSLVRWIALYSPLPVPRGLTTLPQVDPRRDGTKPTDFEHDRARAIAGLRAVAAAPPDALPAAHFAFGAMTAEDWYRWAYRHTDHHLRQFGV
jgi:hypothetical protein